MDTKPLESFAKAARRELIAAVSAQASAVLAPGSVARTERAETVRRLETEIAAHGHEHVIDRVAYTWFNRLIALRFMDAKGYTGAGIVSPAQGQAHGQPEILADAKRGDIDADVVTSSSTRGAILGLLDGTRRSTDAEGEAYALLLTEYCRYWHKSMPFMFEREGDYTELLVPAGLLADGGIVARARNVLTEEVCDDVEVIGWLYQFYISERKDEVFAGFKKNKKAGADEIPAATQLFTPHWIVRYLVENSVGRLWILNRPASRLVERMDYYIAPVDVETDFLKLSGPEELSVIDPACGSGHMLTYAFDLLYAIYEEEGYAPSEIPSLILTHNLHGTEIDPRAGSLAAFALTMKARARQRTFLRNRVEPNICVIRPITFTPGELEFLSSPIHDQFETSIWNQFQHADTFGALVRPRAEMTSLLSAAVEALSEVKDLTHRGTLTDARDVIAQARVLGRTYSVVVANPPYMGAKNMDARLAAFAKEHYPTTKADLFSMFIERCFGFGVTRGLQALVTMQSWMFLPAYAPLREWLSQTSSILNLAHLDNMVMGIAFGTSATVWKKGALSALGTFVHVRLQDLASGVPKQFPPSNDRNQRSPGGAGIYVLRNEDFRSIPGGPIAYWVSDRVRKVFSIGTRLDSIAEPRQGMATSDNARFLRYAFEIGRSRIAFGCESRHAAALTNAKWFPYSKGGERRKWYGNHDLVVNWANDGRELTEFAASLYGSASRTIKNTRYYFRPALTWSLTSSSGFAARYRPAGFIFDVNGMSSFGDGQLEEILATVNSSVGNALLSVINPTMAFQAGDLKAFPYISPDRRHDVSRLVHECIRIAQEDWDSQELSWDFTGNGLVDRASDASALQSVVTEYLGYWRARVEALADLETQLNVISADTYGMRGDVTESVGASEVNLINNARFRDSSQSVPRNAEEIRDLVSYAVGCMFGRFSLDEPGLILADQGSTLQDYFAKVPAPKLVPDTDNVIPFVDDGWFEDDIVDRFRQFLRAAFGAEHFEQNLRFVEESLGVRTLRDYFITKGGQVEVLRRSRAAL